MTFLPLYQFQNFDYCLNIIYALDIRQPDLNRFL